MVENIPGGGIWGIRQTPLGMMGGCVGLMSVVILVSVVGLK